MAIKTYEELRKELDNKVEELNKVLAKGEAVSNADETALKELARDTTKQAVKERFTAWKNTENPIKTALETLFVPNYSAKLVTDKDTAISSYVVNESSKVFDLAAFVRFCPNQVTASKTYVVELGIVTTLFAARVAKEIGDDWKTVIAKHRLPVGATRPNATQKADPISNGSIEKALQATIDAIYKPEENVLKVRSKDVKFIVYQLTRQGKNAFAVNTGKAKQMSAIICKVLHCQLKGLDYTVEFDKIED